MHKQKSRMILPIIKNISHIPWLHQRGNNVITYAPEGGYRRVFVFCYSSTPSEMQSPWQPLIITASSKSDPPQVFQFHEGRNIGDEKIIMPRSCLECVWEGGREGGREFREKEYFVFFIIWTISFLIFLVYWYFLVCTTREETYRKNIFRLF